MLSVDRLFADLMALTVVPLALAIVISMSPDLTVYIFSPLEVVSVAPPVALLAVVAELGNGCGGMWIFFPICNFFGSTPGLASSRALIETWYCLAIDP